MDPITGMLANSVVTILTPYVKQTAEAFIDTAGQAAYEKAKGLFDALKTRWVGKSAATNLQEFQSDPDGSQEILRAVLKKQFDNDPELKADVDKRINDLGPVINAIQNLDRARHVTTVDAERVHSGTINAQQSAKDAEDATTVRVKDFG